MKRQWVSAKTEWLQVLLDLETTRNEMEAARAEWLRIGASKKPKGYEAARRRYNRLLAKANNLALLELNLRRIAGVRIIERATARKGGDA